MKLANIVGMSHYDYTSDIKRLQIGLATIDLPITDTPSTAHTCPIPCSLIRNDDGSIRWLWPTSAEQPDFLRFYHRGSLKAQWFVRLVQLLFRLKLGRWVAQDRLTFYTTEAGYQLLKRTQLSRWALFTGTAGPNRKLVLWYSTRTNERYFAKIALTPAATANLQIEAVALRSHQRQPFEQFYVPRLITFKPQLLTGGMLVQQDMGLGNTKPVNQLTNLPAGALSELLSRNWCTKPLHQATFWPEAKETITHVRLANDPRIPTSLLDKLDRLMQSLNEETRVSVAAAHGDFTPWNIMLNESKLVVIDWELYRAELPGLYDLFHFLYQSKTLLGNQGFTAVRREVNTTLNQAEWQQFGKTHQVDTDLAEMLYLIHTITYYLSVYSRQAEWHQQVNWLLTTWNDALTYWLSQKKSLTKRQLVLHDTSFWLHQQPYAALKFMPAQLDALPESSDLDLCMPQGVASQVTQYLQQHPLINQIVVDHRSFMKQLHIHCHDGTTLHLDLIWTFKRKQLEFMPAEPVWEQATLAPHGLKVPTSESEKTYIRLFYGLNNALVPAQYQAMFGATDLRSTSAELAKAVRQFPQNRGWRGVVNSLAYIVDTLRAFGFRRGMIVTFSGVDGAGKSTVIEQTKYEIEKRLRQRVVVLRHRPSLLPILSSWKYGRKAAEQRSADRLPHQGTNQSRVSSLLRFGYYFADYLLGQFYIQAKYVWRGYIVLYDRYYFDFINDSRRSNLQLPSGLAGRLYSLLLKPRLNIFLYAPPEEILRRKQELDSATITHLTQQYLGLFDSLQKQYPGSEYMPILNQDLSLTLRRIFNRIQHLS